MGFFSQLLHNYVLICSLLGWTTAQLIKTVYTSIRDRQFNFERLFGAGGMPSGHSATVSAMVVSVSRRFGASSVYFALAVVIAAVVIYDAMGVRRQAGEHAKVLNEIVRVSKEDDDEKNDIIADELNELLGHTPVQVIAGILLGALIPYIVPLM